jgi:hypothetical protein
MAHTPPAGVPIKIDSTSNGEFFPLPIGRTLARANQIAAHRITQNAGRTGRSRRAFMASLCGAATALLTFDEAFAARGNVGGRFRVGPDAAFDEDAAAQVLAGNEFIFDIQTHMVEPDGPWRNGPSRGWADRLARWPQGDCGEIDAVDCYSSDHFIKEVFLDSDTDMAVLSFVPTAPGQNPLSMFEAARVRDLIEKLDGTDRLLLHNGVMPKYQSVQAMVDGMAESAATYDLAAWKVYTQFGPDGTGWWLDDDEVGIPFIEQARALGIRTICIHKGLPFGGLDPQFAGCEDVGRVARMFPDVKFIIFHSGYQTTHREGPYVPGTAHVGIDTLIQSLLDNGVAPNSNVYAELGSTWRSLIRNPTAAAQGLGKLLKYVGRSNLLWGTDSIWYGSPQDQIQAFRAFEISEELRERHGYPDLTPDLKAKILGLNAAAVFGVNPVRMQDRAAADPIGHLKMDFAAARQPSFGTYGPRTAAEFRYFTRLKAGRY